MGQPNRTAPERNRTSKNLGALIGSRICHDLISPVGAISNGLELMSLAGAKDGPEMQLISGSAANASARIRFFRVAFGMSCDGQSMGDREIRGILDDTYTARLACDWQVTGPLPRRMARAGLLALLCGEEAAPFGGTMTVSGGAAGLHLVVEATRLGFDPRHWAWLGADGAAPREDLPAAQVQFALLADLLAEMNRTPRATMGESRVTLEI